MGVTHRMKDELPYPTFSLNSTVCEVVYGPVSMCMFLCVKERCPTPRLIDRSVSLTKTNRSILQDDFQPQTVLLNLSTGDMSLCTPFHNMSLNCSDITDFFAYSSFFSILFGFKAIPSLLRTTLLHGVGVVPCLILSISLLSSSVDYTTSAGVQ